MSSPTSLSSERQLVERLLTAEAQDARRLEGERLYRSVARAEMVLRLRTAKLRAWLGAHYEANP